MSGSLEDLDLDAMKTAWSRVRHDLDQRVFIRSAFQPALIDDNFEAWVEPHLDALARGAVHVEPLYVAPVPKGHGLIRPGAWLPLHEHLTYTALVQLAYPSIYEAMGGKQGRLDLAYQLRKPGVVRWLRPRFECYREFQNVSEALARKASHVVFVDVAAYYENVNLDSLKSQLRELGVSADVVDVLFPRMLRPWEITPGMGLPQGVSASDILAKVYLDPVDRELASAGQRFVRYVDDVRIFVNSEAEAKKVLVRYIELLRFRGLQVQSRKTMILRQPDALAEIQGAAPMIARINKQYTKQVLSSIDVTDADPYMPVFRVDQLVEEHPGEVSDAPIVDELSKAFQQHGSRIQKNVLHYLFNRLAKLRSVYGWRDLVALLRERPEETAYILGHVAKVGVVEQTEPIVVEFLASEQAVYSYQCYQLLDWIGEHVEQPSGGAVLAARRFEREASAWYVRTAARRVLANAGEIVDLNHLAEQHQLAPNLHREDIDLLFCLERMERSRRNRILGRARDRHPLYRFADVAVRGRGAPQARIEQQLPGVSSRT